MRLPAPNIRWHWLLLLFNLNWFSYIDAKEVRVVCYYTNWSVYRPGTAKFSPQNINPYLCTHLIYAFGGFTKDNILKPFDKYQDIEKVLDIFTRHLIGGYAKFTGLKTYNKQLKTLLAIGGWNEGSSKFSPLVASPERRKELVKNVVKFLRQNHFDGLDLDWEYPSFRDGGKPRDRDNYAQFVQELREEFERENEKTGRPRLLLTMAVPAGIEYINKGYDIPKLTKYLDWMNILSYDYHSAFEPSVNHHAPLYPLEADSEYNYDTELNIDYTIKHYLKLGADSRKLVLGIPTYGRSYTLFNPDSNDIGAPADGPGDMGDATRENGYLAYYEICEYVKSKSWTVVQPNEDAMGPYAYKDNQWVGYDDENIVRRKAEYVAKNNLGGIMFWAIDNDDFRGVCHDKPYPLIEASKEAMIKAFGLGNQTSVGGQKTSSRTRSRGRPSTTSRPSTTDSTINETDDIEKPSRRRPSNKSDSRKSSGSRRRRPSSTRSTTTTTEEPLIVGSSLLVTTPSYKTPEPPTTPDPGGDFKCEDEGFFPHPRDCKKYFWCLAGPSELGIIAHQFTCPAGLYFNKAASSCDYTQNVLCNKKKTTTTSTTTPIPIQSKSSSTEKTTAASPLASLFSTRRPLPKITAATSRTTFKATTSTTEGPEDEDDYEEYEDDPAEGDKVDSEEDPQVIKELLNLIKKAGGIDELEKQLKLHEHDSSAPGGGTGEKSTKSTISKELYERVLKRTKSNEERENNINNFRYNTINRNSRGPQNLGITPEVREEKTEKGNSKYSTITRQRSGPQSVKADEDDEYKAVSARSQNIPEYVTIRRTRYSTTEANIIDEDDLTDNEDDRETFNPPTTKSSGLQYNSIRRSRPTTQSSNAIEASSSYSSATSTTVKPYIAIRRSRPTTTTTTQSSPTKAAESSTASVTTISSTIVEGTSTVKSASSSVVPDQELRTAIPVIEVVDERSEDQVVPDNPTSGTNTLPISDSSSLSDNKLTYTHLNSDFTSLDQPITTVLPSIPPKSFIQLAKPRPFSFTPRLLIRPSSTATSTAAEPSSTTASSANKVSQSTQDTSSSHTGRSKSTPTKHTVHNLNSASLGTTSTTTTTRGRGKSRFRLDQQIHDDNTALSNQQSFASSQALDDLRQYRPDMTHEIGDLSSLTAFDLALGSGEVGSTHRGRRPISPTAASLGNRRRTQVPSLVRDVSTTPQSSTLRPTRRVIKVIRPQLRQRLPFVVPFSTTLVPELSHNSILYSSRNRFSSDEDQSEDENINLSETIRQESNDIGNSFGSTDEKGRRIVKRIRSTTVKPTTFSNEDDFTTLNNDEDEFGTTRSSSSTLLSSTVNSLHDKSLHRTRKIIRKLPTTTESLPHESRTAHLGRTRKIIRRLSSTTPGTTLAEGANEEFIISSTVKSRLLTYSRTRPTTTHSSTTEASTEAVPLDVTTLSDEDVLTTTEENTFSTKHNFDDDSLNTILDNSSTDNILSTISLDDEGTTLFEQPTTEGGLKSTADTTAKSSTLNYINKSIRNRLKTQDKRLGGDEGSTVKIRPIKLAGAGQVRQNYFGSTNRLEDRPDKPLTERPSNSYRRNRFRPKTSSTTEDNLDELEVKSKNVGGTTASNYKRKLYRFRSTTSSTTIAQDDNEEEIVEETEQDKPSNGKTSTTISDKPGQVKIKFRPSFASSTTSTTTERSDIDQLNLNNKRKQLFNRDRVMNTPYFASTTSSTEVSSTSDGTTEKPTTLHHVFAQTEPAESSTDSIEESSTKKVERLIEISRIIESGDVVENKIGEISRITSIKVVDNEINGTKYPQGPVYVRDSTTYNESGRQEKKYDGISKDSNSNVYIGNVITIDGKSSVKTITARPFSKNESSTIPLEGLFQTESPFKTEVPLSENDSPLVKIRLLEQDPFNKGSEYDTNGKLVPVRVLTEEATMKANVVEVKVDPNGTETIRIAPISFEKQIKNAN